MEQAIKCRNLNFAYKDKQVLKNINLSIERGSYVGILGHNGSGKSTLSKLLLGLLEADSGDIEINGIKMNEDNIKLIRNEIGIVFQNPDNQFIGCSVADDIAFGLENHNVDPSKMDDIIKTMATKVGMQNFLNHEPEKLSGGQKQRVAIAGVLAMGLNIIVLDEATSMLDPKGKKEINELIHDLKNKYNFTVISIMHDIEEAINCDKLIVMNDGVIYKKGTPEEVFADEDELLKIGLDIPFVYKLINKLNNKGIIVNKTFELEEVIAELCQLKQ